MSLRADSLERLLASRAAAAARSQLLPSSPPLSSSLPGSSGDSSAAARSLLRTRSLLAAELLRVSAVSSTIEGDAEVLRGAAEEHRGLREGAGTARGVLRGIEAAARKEGVALWASAGAFYAVLLYVVYQRAWIPFLAPGNY
ncbi:hypothetical protein TeGR_g9788 [Tetraparma gracilis]|uniref:Uncharacterized protein n=1 Tax=Tetraparma gracilis TaxID=2962635 RepID=A0ABQ6MMH6_9STRA|nr:hypothetical protein TeGR_g9788 [Tetraparma gracilis]